MNIALFPGSFQFYPRSTKTGHEGNAQVHEALSILSKINASPPVVTEILAVPFNSIQDQRTACMRGGARKSLSFQFYPRSTALIRFLAIAAALAFNSIQDQLRNQSVNIATRKSTLSILSKINRDSFKKY